MKKWQNLAAPDDPDSWYDVDGVWPTPRGTYETADFLGSGSAYTATGVDTIAFAWRFRTTSTSNVLKNSHYIVDASDKIWNFDSTDTGSEMADVTGAVTFATVARFEAVQYGSVTIAVLGSTRSSSIAGEATIYTTGPGTNFAALAGAPQGESICVCSNAVLIFNTSNKDGWAASDVGDYTNWTTGESASGQIFQPAGPIYSAVEYDDSVYVFKLNSIHRMRYVGGVVKWTVEKLFDGIGCGTYNSVCAGATGMLMAGNSSSDTGSPTVPFYWFDGTNPPVCVNPHTEITGQTIVYNPLKNMFTVFDSDGSPQTQWYFSPETMAWGKNTTPAAVSYTPYRGDVLAGGGNGLTLAGWYKSAANTVTRIGSPGNHVGSGYVETMKIGTSNAKLNFSRMTPRFRRLVDSGTQAEAITASCFRELHDTSASSTPTYTKSSNRHTWTGQAADNFIRFKYAFTDYDVEIEDLMPEAIPAGKN